MQVRTARMVTSSFLSLIGLMFLTASASAASLYGSVIDVNDGDTFTIVSLNKPVKIRLLAVVAPSDVQAFADVARQHLSDLILHKTVLVEYSGLVENNLILGKVSCRDVDIGAQMLRDGVAWFDKASSSRLINSDRQIYLDCELAARNEQRGLWRDPAPVAPWDFKNQQQAAKLATEKSTQKPKTSQNFQTLGSEDLLKSFLGSSTAVPLSSSNGARLNSQWQVLAPRNEHFSILVPGEGYQTSRTIPAGDDAATVNYWVMDYEGATFLVMWSRGPNLRYTDATALDETARVVVMGLNRSFERRGIDLVFEAKTLRNLTLNGYPGIQFSVSAAHTPGVIRAFSKQTGSQREFFMIGVLNSSEENPIVPKFLDSLSLDRK
ncbi:MAG TPA: thermonuclease family protein [Pyrinomonadaceae bacterium]